MAIFNIFSSIEEYNNALGINPVSTQDFESFANGTDLDGVEFISGISATSNLPRVEVFQGSEDKELFILDRRSVSDDSFYEINFSESYNAVGFDIEAFNPVTPGPAVLDIEFADGERPILPALRPVAMENEVDSWIDTLDPNNCFGGVNSRSIGVNQEVLMKWLIQQHLPQVELPKFSGSALERVVIITKFRDIVHNQEYLSDNQKYQLLLQHLTGEARRAVKGYSNDTRGYVMSLKKLKYLFGQRPLIAQAVLEKVTKGKAIMNDDIRGLTELSYAINDCLVTLELLSYESDLRSSDTLRQVVRRLPSNMQMRWAEHSLSVRSYEEPNLSHLNGWLQKRVFALK